MTKGSFNSAKEQYKTHSCNQVPLSKHAHTFQIVAAFYQSIYFFFFVFPSDTSKSGRASCHLIGLDLRMLVIYKIGQWWSKTSSPVDSPGWNGQQAGEHETSAKNVHLGETGWVGISFWEQLNAWLPSERTAGSYNPSRGQPLRRGQWWSGWDEIGYG